MAVEDRTRDEGASPVEAISKIAAVASVLLILVLQLAVHPGVSWSLRALLVFAFSGGWLLGSISQGAALVAVAGFAPVLPIAIAVLSGSAGSVGGADPVVQSVWLAAVVGALLPSMSLTRWNLPPTWRVLLGGWALTLSLAWPIVVAREIGFDPRVLADTATINSWAGMSASEVSGWVMYVALVQLTGLLWLDAIMPRLRTWSEAGLPAIVHALWMGATASSLVALYQGTVDLEFLSSAAWASLGRATGLMLDANAYGVIAALAAPLAALAARVLPSPLRWCGAAAFMINWAGVWVSGSRTALLCAVAGTAAFAISEVARRGVRRAIWVSAVGVATALVVALALTVSLSRTTSPLERTEEFADRSPFQVVEELVARGRYGEIAGRMIWEYPLTGVGVGTYHWLAPDYMRVTFDQELAFDNAQNWWRHQLAELGLVGASPVLAWSIAIVWLALRGTRQAPGHHVATVRGLVVGLGTVSLVGMPTQDPVVLMAFFLLVAMLGHDRSGAVAPLGSWEGRSLSRAWMVVAGLAVAYAGGHVALARGSLDVAERASRANRDYVVGMYQEETLPNGEDFRWTRGEARLSLVMREAYLTVRTWIQHPDAAERPVSLRIATPCQVLFEGLLVDSSPVYVVLAPPPAEDRIDLEVRVSHTWSPASAGSPDTRQLGAAVVLDFLDTLTPGIDVSTLVEPCGANARSPG